NETESHRNHLVPSSLCVNIQPKSSVPFYHPESHGRFKSRSGEWRLEKVDEPLGGIDRELEFQLLPEIDVVVNRLSSRKLTILAEKGALADSIFDVLDDEAREFTVPFAEDHEFRIQVRRARIEIKS